MTGQAATSLPPEILSIIFELLMPEIDYVAGSTEDLKWLGVTQVCKSWREVAIEHKTLWTGITTTQPDLFKLFVERSQELPLYTTGDFHKTRNGEGPYMQAVAEQLGRLKALSVSADAEDEKAARHPAQLFGALNAAGHALPLETLSLAFGTRWVNTLSAAFFEHAPSLCDVSLIHVQFPRPATSSNLRALHLQGYTGLSLPDLLENLRGLVGLESLALENATDPYEVDTPDDPLDPPVAPLVLPRLRTLTLRNSFESNTSVVNLIQAEKLESLSVGDWETVEVNPWEDGLFMERLSTHFLRHPLPADLAVSVHSSLASDSNDVDAIKVTAAFRAYPAAAAIRLPTRSIPVEPGFELEVYVEELEDAQDPALQILTLPLFPAGAWLWLGLSGRFLWTPAAFVDALGGAARVHGALVHLEPAALFSFFGALAPHHVRQLRPALPDPLLLPSLGVLNLEGVAFDCPHAECQGRGSLTTMMELALRQRRDVGRPILQIALKKCSGVIPYVHVRGWTVRCGGVVLWDGDGLADAQHEHWGSEQLPM